MWAAYTLGEDMLISKQNKRSRTNNGNGVVKIRSKAKGGDVMWQFCVAIHAIAYHTMSRQMHQELQS
jgi:hypothetical protein